MNATPEDGWGTIRAEQLELIHTAHKIRVTASETESMTGTLQLVQFARRTERRYDGSKEIGEPTVTVVIDVFGEDRTVTLPPRTEIEVHL